MNVKTLNVFSVEAQYISWLLLTMLSLKVVEIVDRAARRGGWQIGVGGTPQNRNRYRLHNQQCKITDHKKQVQTTQPAVHNHRL